MSAQGACLASNYLCQSQLGYTGLVLDETSTTWGCEAVKFYALGSVVFNRLNLNSELVRPSSRASEYQPLFRSSIRPSFEIRFPLRHYGPQSR